MRVEIKLRPLGERPVLPFNYNYEVYRQILEKIAIIDEDLARKIDSSHVGLFTFSRIMVRNRRLLPETGIQILSDTVSLYVSSSFTDVMGAVIEGFMISPGLKLGGTPFNADEVKPLKEPTPGRRVLFSTLSPIMVRSVRVSEGRMHIWDLYPSDDAFQDKLRKVMLLRYKEITGEALSDASFEINVVKFKPVRILMKNSYYRGSLMIFEYRGSRELAMFGYENGFGEKTQYGFGMVKILESKRGPGESAEKGR
ncbi:MAG: CRISPR-associated endoribonuclease Cas6 [Thermococci archaeon]|nr:CRISPR-associated endoribonuclease Cas6 [Thermococci archaeon]